jgi:iron complex outermembrane recepter protein
MPASRLRARRQRIGAVGRLAFLQVVGGVSKNRGGDVRTSRIVGLLCLIGVALALPVGVRASSQPLQDDLKRLTIEQLMQIDVTTAARREEPIGRTAAAVSVITSDDIRRAGVTTIADALQLADGVAVARFNNGTWAISSRGFNSNTANKLLVMVDGRTVYSPLFSGPFWNTLDYILEDVDRIEVIRGPGAALWGANAVNGVINIITRHSRDTQGTFVSASSGNEHPLITEVRQGGATGALSWRAYGKFAGHDAQRLASGADADDPRRRGQVGFRVDGGTADGTSWLLKGDVFHSRDSFPDRPSGEFTDIGLQGRWSLPVAAQSRVNLQAYYRREYRRVPRQLTHYIDIVDVDAQHLLTWARRHDIVWGGGARVNNDETHPSAVLAFDPRGRTYSVLNVFAQDDFAIVPLRLFATVGAKYEHNAFSGGELQPSVRARYLMPRNQIVWGAISRAVRRPTRFDDDILAFAPSGALLVRGSDDFLAETLVASELGYRLQPSRLFSLDATVFRHQFHDLRSQDLPPTGFPIVLGNSLEGNSHGLELGVNVQPVTWWRTHVGYTRLATEIRRVPGSRDVAGGVSEANDPEHLFGLRTSVDLPREMEFDAVLRSVASLPNPAVPAYTELNLRFGWRATPLVEVWVAGQDLLHDQHPEFGTDNPARTEFERAMRVGVTFRKSP